MRHYTISVIPGDGIGPEVIAEAKKVLEATGRVFDFRCEWIEFPFGAEHYLATGKVMDDEALRRIAETDAILLGALGDPRVSERVTLGGIVLKLRTYFDQYVNLRPVKLLRGADTPLRDKTAADINFYVVRENTEDLYSGIGGRVYEGEATMHGAMHRRLYSAYFDVSVKVEPQEELAYQIGVLSRRGCERVIRYAFELARRKGLKRVTGVDKVNAMPDIYEFWRECFERVARDYPDIEYEYNLVDAITMWFVRRPEHYQVVVAPNLFGDIITDLGAAIQGGMGLAPGANINPEGISMFEPIHGSAPRYKGQQRANPMAAVLAGAMMMEHLGEVEAAQAIERAVEQVLQYGPRTYDLGGNALTYQVGDAIAEQVRANTK